MSCGDSGKQIHKYKESCHYSVVVNSFACGFEGPVFETPHGQLSYNWQHAIAINSAKQNGHLLSISLTSNPLSNLNAWGVVTVLCTYID